MAAFFAERGWKDITIAFPLNRLEIDAINRLAKEAALHLLVEAEESVRFLDEHLDAEVHVWIKVDTGYHRSGIVDGAAAEIVSVARAIQDSPKLRFKGLLTHSGHSYNVKGKSALKDVFRDTKAKMEILKARLLDAGFSTVEISVGDTPTCSVVEDFSGVDEIRCGNFVYYDLMQYFIGSCGIEDIAAALACPVVGVYPQREEFVLYGGAVHLSKDFCLDNEGRKVYGYVCRLSEHGWDAPLAGTYVRSLSQEHGIVKTTPEVLEGVRRGDLLAVLPVHSCLTANLCKEETLLI
jgi:D-serine deaminase-like pyridoxal phosphate-dependent protein